MGRAVPVEGGKLAFTFYLPFFLSEVGLGSKGPGDRRQASGHMPWDPEPSTDWSVGMASGTDWEGDRRTNEGQVPQALSLDTGHE